MRLKTAILLTLIICLSAGAEKPNILFILADDQSWETVSAMGGEVKTPNLDRLVHEGVSFRHAYNMGSWSGAVCIASRHMFNTGTDIWRCHEIVKQQNEHPDESISDTVKSWSQQLSAAGYKTYFSGKWHVELFEVASIYDVVGTERPGMPKQTEAGYNRPKDKNDKTWLPWDTENGGYWEGGTHWSEVLRDEAIGFIEEASKQEEPFFMYIAFNAPHDPRQAPEAYVNMYPPEDIRIPENFLPVYPYAEQMGSGKSLRDEKLAPFPRTPYAIQVNRSEYYALITHLDDQIGLILDALKKSGKLDNTYIFYTADHGLAVGHHGLVGKQNMYEHSLGAPLIINGPGLEKGKRITERVYIQDIVPSTLELAKAPIPETMSFKSLMPLARGEAQEGRDVIYGAYKNLQRCVIHDGWKLIYYPTVPIYRLYNLTEDPEEMNDLADHPDYAARLSAMKAVLQQEMKARQDPLIQ